MAVTIDGSGEITGLDEINNIALPTTGFGKVLQVVYGSTATQTDSSSSTYADTNLTATITPSATTSKVLVLVAQAGCSKNTGNTYGQLRLVRGATEIVVFDKEFAYNNSTSVANCGSSSVVYLDSPTTTSATTYKTQFASGANVAGVRVQTSGATSTIVLIEVSA